MKAGTLVDRLGKVQAQIADLKAKEDQLKDKLVDTGMDAIEGKLFRATVADANVETVSWRKLVTHLEKLKGFTVHGSTLSKFTNITGRVTVKVVGRKES